MKQSQAVTQRDFSAGEIFSGAERRSDLPFVRAGARTQVNWRIESNGSLVPRSGRRALFQTSGKRSEYFRMTPSAEFILSFSDGALTIFDAKTGVQVAGNVNAAYLWAAATIDNIIWTQAIYDVVIAFPGMQPQIARYDQAAGTWSFLPYNFRTSATVVYEPFYRRSVLGASMTPSAVSGAIILTCSSNFFTPGKSGQRLSILGQQVTITGYLSPTQANATIAYNLPVSISIAVDDITPFQAGQVVSTKNNGIKMEVFSVTAGFVKGTLMGQLTLPTLTWTGEFLISPLGSSTVTAATTPTVIASGATVQWLEEFMNATAGWPQSCFYDKNRLGFCDFPQAPEGILWSAIGAPDTCWIDSAAAATNPAAGADPSAAILEFIPQKPRVRHVVGWGDEFIFTEAGIFQLPISGNNPLKPGSAEFRQFSNDGCSIIRPVLTQDSIVYVNAGTSRVSMVKATGTYTRPYVSEDLSDLHKHLFTSDTPSLAPGMAPRMLTIAYGDGAHPERYVYVVNKNGSVITGKFTADKQLVGWAPQASAALVSWVSAGGKAVYFSSGYPATAKFIIETEYDGANLDGFIAWNGIPAGLNPAAGLASLWWLGGLTVTLIDGDLDMGDRQVDANGNLVQQNGDILTSATLFIGVTFTSTFEPILHHADLGQDLGQGQTLRKIKQISATVEHTAPFSIDDRVFTVNTFNVDGSVAPALKKATYRARPPGRVIDPSVKLIKSRPGIFRLKEIIAGVTV